MMTTEMDLLRMDERQRLAWLMANRGTLIVVGLAWIGLIVRELAQGRMPLLLIVLVPVFAAIRGVLFFYYCSTDISGRAGMPGRARWFKTGAAVLLGLALVLPLYEMEGKIVAEPRLGFSWDLLREDGFYAVLLAPALLWPIATLTLSRNPRRRRLVVLTQLVEPLLAALSVLILLWIPQFQWESGRTLWTFFLIESARPAAGTYLAVTANGLYFVAWLWDTLRPWVLRAPRAQVA